MVVIDDGHLHSKITFSSTYEVVITILKGVALDTSSIITTSKPSNLHQSKYGFIFIGIATDYNFEYISQIAIFPSPHFPVWIAVKFDAIVQIKLPCFYFYRQPHIHFQGFNLPLE